MHTPSSPEVEEGRELGGVGLTGWERGEELVRPLMHAPPDWVPDMGGD
jgi:hypothetical protein